jgi:Cu-Zn family superoxide dismutase
VQPTGALLIAVLCFAAPEAWAQFPEARAILVSCSGSGAVVGSATLIETPSAEGIKNVTVMLSVNSPELIIRDISGNPVSGKRAVHIHEVASCQPCSSAGSHLDFNRNPATLAMEPNNVPVHVNHPYHSGDLINLPINTQGRGSVSHVTSRVAITTPQLSIFDGNGSSIVIHALPDLYCPDPSDANCAGGGRAACGILQRTQ